MSLGRTILFCLAVAAALYFLSLPLEGTENCVDDCPSETSIHAMRYTALGLLGVSFVLAMIAAAGPRR